MSYGCDWVCKCGWGNLDVRLKCRNCGAENPERPATPSSPVSSSAPVLAREASTQIEDLWFTDKTLPILAISGDDEHDSVICLHYRRPATNEDRDQVVAALNAALAPSPASGVREALRDALKPFAVIADEFEAAYTKPLPDDAPVANGWLKLGECRRARAALAALSSPATPEPVSAPAGEVRAASDNGKRWRIIPIDGDWEMQPVGHITAQQAEAICKRIERALSNPAPGHGEAER